LGDAVFDFVGAAAPAGTHEPYTTTFFGAENLISEGGKRMNGQTDGLEGNKRKCSFSNHGRRLWRALEGSDLGSV